MKIDLKHILKLFHNVFSYELLLDGDCRDDIIVWLTGAYQWHEAVELWFPTAAPSGEKPLIKWDETGKPGSR
jgi:hypothetical protein